ncbi:MAG: hypothetical protein QXV17_10920 [Candidatus Micrarchaeaceae archaeon]
MKLILGIFIGLIALFVIGFAALSIIFPPFAGLALKTFSSFFASPSNNNTFSSKSLNFTYPQNWIEINPTVITSSFAKNLNATKLANLSSIQVLIPSSSMVSLLGSGPALLSSLSSKNSSIPKEISGILSNTNLMLVGAINLSQCNISNKTNLTSSTSKLYKVVNISNSSKVNISFAMIRGMPAFTATFSNLTYESTIHIPYGSLAGIIDGKHLCFVFAFAGRGSELSQTSYAFDRVYKSVEC